MSNVLAISPTSPLVKLVSLMSEALNYLNSNRLHSVRNEEKRLDLLLTSRKELAYHSEHHAK